MITRLIILIVLLTGLNSCTNFELLQEMAKVDQAYIPTIYYLGQENLEEAKPNMKKLREKWQRLSSASHQINLSEEEAFKVAKINSLIKGATRAFVDDDAYHAYCSLKDAQLLWSDWRACNGMEYYIDYLYTFQNTWAVVLEHLEEPSICQLDWKTFYKDVTIAQQSWNRAKLATVEWDLFEVDSAQQQLFSEKKNALNQALKIFEKESSWAHLENMAYQANIVTQQLDDLLNVFGNFNNIA